MCLIAIAYQAFPGHSLVVAANRDESYARPTVPAHFWEDQPDILAGRDLEAGGTWLGMTRSGRFAAITNFREPGKRIDNAPSRGHLVSDFLAGGDTAEDCLGRIARGMQAYNGFNLLACDDSGLFYLSNRAAGSDAPRKLAPGVYGLSNHLLDTPWPKVTEAKRRMAAIVSGGEPLETLMTVLGDRQTAPVDTLPDTRVGAERERALSAIFIANDFYGTRCSTLVDVSSDGHVRFIEQNFLRNGVAGDTLDIGFDLRP